jgi:L,D-peptidoglycan transpeptidase YkuD (ErfK/YbiS/YcfS/YnhG family)
MSVGRVVSSVVSCVAVVGCATVVVGMTRANTAPTADERAAATSSPTPRPAFLPPTGAPTTSTVAAPVSPASPASTGPAGTSTPAPSPAATSVARTTAPASTVPISVVPGTPRVVALPPTTAPVVAAPRRAAPAVRRPASTPAPKPRPVAAAPVGQALPLGYSTGNATRVVTVTATSSRATTATVQAWTKVATHRWKKYGSAIKANVGADGIGAASETRSKTPAGSFTLTQAFGRNADPGTALPYFKTKPSDYWISSPGRLYNTHQRCASCGYNNGVNERLYYTTPYYNYAVLIDYNTRNAPGGVKAGKGSAFFLHVSVGSATAGCVAIPQSRLVPLMRWLTPGAHPRMLIGVR